MADAHGREQPSEGLAVHLLRFAEFKLVSHGIPCLAQDRDQLLEVSFEPGHWPSSVSQVPRACSAVPQPDRLVQVDRGAGLRPEAVVPEGLSRERARVLEAAHAVDDILIRCDLVRRDRRCAPAEGAGLQRCVVGDGKG